MATETIGVVGLGYVGLPLAMAFARKGFAVTGFDIDAERIAALERGFDWTGEVSADELRRVALRLTAEPGDLASVSFYIVTVPTPIDVSNQPDMSLLLNACDLIGPRLAVGDVVVFESTVYPGATEEVCAPALERASGLSRGRGFKLAYSPERINPGDAEHPVEKIIKVVSAEDEETLERVADVYGRIIEAGIHRAPSIKVAEAAKVIENTQRDVNIALMNEISKICDLVGIRTADVLAAARTKWNFLAFYPGLVGGHCIGVDPYYLTSKAQALGYHPEVILSGRRINHTMGSYVARQAIQRLAAGDRPIGRARAGLLGVTFKENVPDYRNSRVFDILAELAQYSVRPIVHDPVVDANRLQRDHGTSLSPLEDFADLDLLILAVSHDFYRDLSAERICAMIAVGGILIDVRSRFRPSEIRADIRYWAL